MKRTLMVFAAVAAFVGPAMAPLAALAQGQSGETVQDRPSRTRGDGARPGRQGGGERTARSDRGGRSDSSDRGGQPSRPDRSTRGGGAGADVVRPDRPTQDRPARPERNQGGAGGWSGDGARPDRSQQPQTPARPGRPDRGQANGGAWTGGGERPWRPDRPDRPERGGQNGGQSGGWNGGDRDGRPGRSPNGGWNGANGNNGGWTGNRDRDHREWRNRFDSGRWQQNWNRNHRSDWWRNDYRFRGWSGTRFGFYFAPGYGYYNVPRSYYGRTYYEGDYLPSIFWRYSVDDYRTYGLGYPPEGTRWVYVDNAIYLIDQYDGYIIDVIRNAWSW